jgi:hypothetical protein
VNTGRWTIEVGYTVSRPVIPDEAYALVVVSSDDALDAELAACQIVACHCVMPTSSAVVGWPG